jgi:hypothetical protein
MKTIYDEAVRRLRNDINLLERQLEMCHGLSRANVLSKQLKNYTEMLIKLENEFKSTTAEEAEYRVLLGKPYMTGDSADESIVYCLTVHAPA